MSNSSYLFSFHRVFYKEIRPHSKGHVLPGTGVFFWSDIICNNGLERKIKWYDELPTNLMRASTSRFSFHVLCHLRELALKMQS